MVNIAEPTTEKVGKIKLNFSPIRNRSRVVNGIEVQCVNWRETIVLKKKSNGYFFSISFPVFRRITYKLRNK